MKNERSRRLRSIEERELGRVRGGTLWPAVKLSDAVVTVFASDVFIKYGDISGEAID